MRREQTEKLIRLIVQNGCRTSERTIINWGMAVVDALSATDADAAFESLRRRFSRAYGRRLGGCTAPLVGGFPWRAVILWDDGVEIVTGIS